jgi:hypothetical protein
VEQELLILPELHRRRTDNTMAKRRRTDNAMAKRRTDNAMAKRRRTIEKKTAIYKALHRKRQEKCVT